MNEIVHDILCMTHFAQYNMHNTLYMTHLYNIFYMTPYVGHYVHDTFYMLDKVDGYKLE